MLSSFKQKSVDSHFETSFGQLSIQSKLTKTCIMHMEKILKYIIWKSAQYESLKIENTKQFWDSWQSWGSYYLAVINLDYTEFGLFL